MYRWIFLRFKLLHLKGLAMTGFLEVAFEIYMKSFRPSSRVLSIQVLVKSLIFDGRANFEHLLLNVRSNHNDVFFIFRPFWYLCFIEIKTLVRGEQIGSCHNTVFLIFSRSSVISTVWPIICYLYRFRCLNFVWDGRYIFERRIWRLELYFSIFFIFQYLLYWNFSIT